MKLHSIMFEQEESRRKVALAVLAYGGKVLIVRRTLDSWTHAGKWGFPGGGINPGETSLEAILRECEEEIGVVPIGIELLGKDGHITWFMGELPCDPEECIDLELSEHDNWVLVDEESMSGYDMIDGMEEAIALVLAGENFYEVI